MGMETSSPDEKQPHEKTVAGDEERDAHISQSTVMITESQIMGSNGDALHENEPETVAADENSSNSNTQSMIVVPPEHADTVAATMSISMPDEASESDEDDKHDVENDYEIPSFDKSIEAELAAKSEQSKCDSSNNKTLEEQETFSPGF